ncbi:MAG: class A beta-lactamase-related serine hydrolase [Opitutus sp.]|nr:class A beta-lactamase-related serine hydrolase [Opitutus sp.]
MKITSILVAAFLASVCARGAAESKQPYATPRFIETDRRAKVDAVLPQIDKAFRDAAAQRKYPGLVWGIVLDGELVHSGAAGFANVEKKIPATADTRFRIASMTKSFTALAILKLRDAGKLGLADPVEKFLPEFRKVAPLTVDAPPITVRHLLTMTPGFPEDNPWGDRQLAVSIKDFSAFIAGGVSLSNAPGIAFEYSNLAFALLGQIISRISGEPYQRYITREILGPLGMKDTVWEFNDVPVAKLALGYRLEKDGWRLEPLLHDGTYGAMGGLLTTINDFARYVSFHLSAWPARNDADNGIVRRASVREMQKPAEFANLSADTKNRAGELVPSVGAYGYGLSWQNDSKGVVRVGHGGGLPGFGSYYLFYPDYGFAVISFANLTYAGTAAATGRVGAILIEDAKLPRRELPPSTILETRKRQIAELIQSWDPKLADAIVAENFFPDRSREAWATLSRETLAKAGAIKSVGAMTPQNQLRGTFSLVGENGLVNVFFTLTPEIDPRVQQLRLTFVAKP